MKHFFSFLTVMAAVVFTFGCNKDKNVSPTLTPLSEETISVASEGAQFEVFFKLENPAEDGKITAESAGDWITVVNVQDSKVTFEAAANTDENQRETEVTVYYEYSGQKLSFKTKITQAGVQFTTPAIKLESNEVIVFADGGLYEAGYTIVNPVAGAEVSASVADADWISGIDCSTENVVKFDVLKNSRKEARSAQLTIRYTYEGGETSASVTISQEANENGSDYDVELNAKVFDGVYYGAKFSSSSANYWTILSDNGYTESGYIKNNSTYFRLDLFGTFPEDKENIFIPEGTYELDMSNSHKVGSFTYTFSRYIYTDANGGAWEEKIVEGTLTVTREGNDYAFDLVCKTEEGKRCHVTYTGAQLFEDKSQSEGPATGSTITDDYAAMFDGGSAAAKFHGDSAGNGTGFWAFELNPAEGLGDGMGLSLYSATNSFGDFPTGTFTVSESHDANTLAPGVIDGKYLSGSCLYIYGIQNQITGFALYNEGTVTVEKVGSDYKITVDVKDELGHKVTGTWQGKISLTNESSSSVKVPEMKKITVR